MFRIKLSSAELTMTGEALGPARERHLTLWADDLKSRGVEAADMSDETRKKVQEEVPSVRGQEISFLKQLCFVASGLMKSTVNYIETQRVFKMINEAQDFIDLGETDLKRLQNAFERMGQSRPPYVLYLTELIRQLKDPERVGFKVE